MRLAALFSVPVRIQPGMGLSLRKRKLTATAAAVATEEPPVKKKPAKRAKSAAKGLEEGLEEGKAPKPKASRQPKKRTWSEPGSVTEPWTEGALLEGLAHISAADARLAPLAAQHGFPERLLPSPQPAFHSICASIVSQQLSTTVARTIFRRVLEASQGEGAETLAPAAVLAAGPEALRGAGLSGAKAAFLRDLAARFEAGQLSTEAIRAMGDAALYEELMEVKGIGRWTVDMVGMFQLGRRDILPVGDLGVRRGFQRLYGLKELPDVEKMEEISDCWRPYRSLGSWLMWKVPAPEPKPPKAASTKAGKAGGKGRKPKEAAAVAVVGGTSMLAGEGTPLSSAPAAPEGGQSVAGGAGAAASEAATAAAGVGSRATEAAAAAAASTAASALALGAGAEPLLPAASSPPGRVTRLRTAAVAVALPR